MPQFMIIQELDKYKNTIWGIVILGVVSSLIASYLWENRPRNDAGKVQEKASTDLPGTLQHHSDIVEGPKPPDVVKVTADDGKPSPTLHPKETPAESADIKVASGVGQIAGFYDLRWDFDGKDYLPKKTNNAEITNGPDGLPTTIHGKATYPYDASASVDVDILDASRGRLLVEGSVSTNYGNFTQNPCQADGKLTFTSTGRGIWTTIDRGTTPDGIGCPLGLTLVKK